MPQAPEDIRAALRASIAAMEGGASCKGPGAPAAPRARRSPSAPSAVENGRPGSAPDDAERAFRKIERLSLVREQASEQLRQRLARDGFEPEAAEAALERALACGLVDDRRFADVLVRSRLAQGRGRRGIAAELESLGIDPEAVEALAEDGDGEAEEVERALALLDRKPPHAKNRRDAAYRRLAQKGFGASVSSTAARFWCEAHPE